MANFKRNNKKTQKVNLTEEQKALRALICDNKGELIDSKEYFDVGVDGTVLRARVTGAGMKAIKFSFNIGGISTKEKATPADFFLDYDELDDNLVSQLEEFLGNTEVVEEEIADENITLFGVAVPAK